MTGLLPGLLKARELLSNEDGLITWSGEDRNVRVRQDTVKEAIEKLIDPAIAAERQSGEGREDLHDFMTLRDVWRGAMIHMRNLAVRYNDDANISYWTHEIEVFGKTMAAVDAALRARAGTFAEGVEASAVKAEENKLYWAAKVDPLNFSDASNAVCRAKSAACFQVEIDIRALTPPPPPEVRGFQNRVGDWLLACFGAEISNDKQERNHRFLEEAIELVQACGCTQSEAHQLVDYVYDRDQGDVNQEVGGVMVTLAALCRANGFDMQGAGETELMRVWTKVETIRAKQAAKPKHSPLPEVRGDDMSATARDYARGEK